MTTPTLLRYVAFQSNYWLQYLQCNYGGGDLKYSAESVLDLKQPYTKFQLVPVGSTNFIHIKNCYNNKYWAATSVSDSHYVGAIAAEPNEDQSSPSCTLFELIEWTNQYHTTVLYIRHVKLDKYLYVNVTMSQQSGDYRSVYLADKPTDDMTQAQGLASHLIVDFESFLVLPKYVAFNGDNGKYLHTVRNDETETYDLQFSGDDIGDSSVVFEVSYSLTGGLVFKCVEVGYYWRYELKAQGRITYVMATDPDIRTGSGFYGTKIDNDTLALRTNNNAFCQRFSINETPSGIDSLSDRVSCMIKETHLTVKEPAIPSSKSIYNVIFDLSNSSVYNVTLKEMASASGSNETKISTTLNLKLGYYRDTASSTWNNSLSLTLGSPFSFSTGIPIIDSGEAVVSAAKFEGSYSWGETKETSREVSSNYTVTVPPMTRVKVTLMASQGQCDVPFSYVQRYTLYNGQTVMEELKDGMYKGVNYYNFFFKNEEFSLET